MTSENLDLAVAEGVAVKVFDFRLIGTASEAHRVAEELFREITDHGGGFDVVSSTFLMGGRTKLVVVAWVPQESEGLFPEVTR